MLARGIDVPEVDLVINYDVPMVSNVGYMNPDYANFMHRSGRTGRFGTDGLALTLVADELSDAKLTEIEKYYNITITEIKNIGELVDIYNEMRMSEKET